MSRSILEIMASIPTTVSEAGKKLVYDIIRKRMHNAAKDEALALLAATLARPELIQRSEKLRIRMTVPEGHAKKCQHELSALVAQLQAGENDTVHIDYELNMDYVGEVVQKLGAVISLGKKGFITTADLTELIHNRSLFVEVLRMLDQLPKYVPK